MAFKMFWDNHLLFTMLPESVQGKDKEDDATLLNPVLGTLAEATTATDQTIKISPSIVLDTEGVLYIGSSSIEDGIGVEKIYYTYDPANPYYITNCERNYNGNGAYARAAGCYLYRLPAKEGQLSRFLRLIEPSLDEVYEKTTSLPALKDPKTCPASYLPYLAEERGWADLDLTKEETYQRKFVEYLPEIYKNKGTKKGIADLIYLIGNIKGQVFNYWDLSIFIEEVYGESSYIAISAITGTPDNERFYQVRVPTLNTDYDEVRKVISYSRPACQTCEIYWTSFYDDFSTALSCWALGAVSKTTLTSSDTLVLERGTI